MNAQEGEMKAAVATGVASGYAYRGVEHSGAAWQTAVEGSLNGWRGSLWLNHPLDSAEPRERQLSLSYAWPVIGALEVQVRGIQFWHTAASTERPAIRSFETAVQLKWITQKIWRPGLSLAYHDKFRSRAIEATLGYEVALKKFGTYLEMRIYGGHVTADNALPGRTAKRISDAYGYYGVDMRLPYRIGHWSIAAEASLVGAFSLNQAWFSPRHREGPTGLLSFVVRFDK